MSDNPAGAGDKMFYRWTSEAICNELMSRPPGSAVAGLDATAGHG
jgi:hypothetical protein